MNLYPTTIEEAKKQTYGYHFCKSKWDPKRCAYEVTKLERGSIPDQCRFKPGFGPSDLYCKMHAKRFGPVKPQGKGGA